MGAGVGLTLGAALLAGALSGCGARGTPGSWGSDGAGDGRNQGDGGDPDPGSSGRRGGGTGGRAGGGSGTGGPGKGGSGTGGCSSSIEVVCRGTCVDLSWDPGNCGSCGALCPAGFSCSAGQCTSGVPEPGSCRPGETYCSNFGQCVHLPSNSFACGSCYSPCSGGHACIDGTCDQGLCIQGLVPCSDASGWVQCANTSTDAANCGACGRACEEWETCTEGRCTPVDCGVGYEYCIEWGCTDTSYDVTRCGGCETSCPTSSIFDYEAYECNSGVCGCSGVAIPCGEGCTTHFWYCPPPDFAGSAPELCRQLARTGYQDCACGACLEEIEICSQSPSCMNAMDCTLVSTCLGCGFDAFSLCGDQTGMTDPRAEALVNCMNARCGNF